MKNTKIITISIPVKMDQILSGIINDATKNNLIVSKSSIIVDALRLYFDIIAKQNKENKED